MAHGPQEGGRVLRGILIHQNRLRTVRLSVMTDQCERAAVDGTLAAE